MISDSEKTCPGLVPGDQCEGRVGVSVSEAQGGLSQEIIFMTRVAQGPGQREQPVQGRKEGH